MKKSGENKGANIKVIVTGGSGFIGSHIVNECVSRGWSTHIIDNKKPHSKSINKKAKYHEVDIRNLSGVRRIIKGAKHVFHLAALPRVQYSIKHPIETTEANVIGTMNVLIASKEGGVKRVVYSASSSAYGDQSKLPLFEDMRESPKSPYGLQKFVGELYCRLWNEVYGLETVSLRYFNIYGPGMSAKGSYPLVMPLFFDQVKSGRPMTVTGDGNQTRDFTHVRDVVRANLLAAFGKKVGKGEVINIGAGRSISINRIAKLIGGKVTHIAPRLEPRNTLADNRLAKRLLGWKPRVSIEEGVGELKKIWGIE